MDHVALVSSVFPNAIYNFIFKNFPGEQSISVERIFENESSWDYQYF